MEEPTPSPSDPSYQDKRDQVAAQRIPPDVEDQPPTVRPDIAEEPLPTLAVEPPVTQAAALEQAAARTDQTVLGRDEVATRPDESMALPAVPSSGMFTLGMLIWLAVWGGLMALTLDHKFDRPFDWDTSYFSIAARNLATDGFKNLKGGVYLTAGDFGDKREFYAGHPPMTAWLLAGWMKLWKVSDPTNADAIIRALPLAFTLLNLLLLYTLLSRVFGKPAALASTVIASLLPMTAFYAQNVNMEPFLMTFLLGAALSYLSWAKNNSRFGLFMLLVCVALGCWTDWPMYPFAAFLAVLHFLGRRELLPGEQYSIERAAEQSGQTIEDQVTPASRPILSCMALIVLPLAVFAVFLVYLKTHDSSFTELKGRVGDHAPDPQKASRVEGIKAVLALSDPEFDMHAAEPSAERGGVPMPPRRSLAKRIADSSFIKAFTPPALLLAALGLLFWRTWSRRLSLASGDPARRAAFRIFTAFLLTQLFYIVAFPWHAWKHEFWQYYLIVPVAAFAGCFCAWLTLAGGLGRGFFAGLVDRAAWAVAIMIPLAAFGHFAYRMHIPLPGRPIANEGAGLRLDYIEPLRKHTSPKDLILTDADEADIQFTLPWYANRYILPNGMGGHDTVSEEGIAKILEKFPGRRVLYMWEDRWGSEKFFREYLNKPDKPRFDIGPAMIYVIRGEGDGAWDKAGIKSATLPATSPIPSTTRTTKPATAPATTRTAP